MNFEYQGTDYTRLITSELQGLDYKIEKIEVERLADRSKNIPNSTFTLSLINRLHADIPVFLKIGSWLIESKWEFSRGLQNEQTAYKHLGNKYPNNIGSHYAGMIQSRDLGNNIGFLLLNWMDLKEAMWRDPLPGDDKMVKKALLYLENAGIVHLDIVQNLKIRKDGDSFFWMDFERMVIDSNYQYVYDESIDSLALRICKSKKEDGSFAMIPTPSPKEKQTMSRVYLDDDQLYSPSSQSRRNLFGSPSSPKIHSPSSQSRRNLFGSQPSSPVSPFSNRLRGSQSPKLNIPNRPNKKNKNSLVYPINKDILGDTEGMDFDF